MITAIGAMRYTAHGQHSSPLFPKAEHIAGSEVVEPQKGNAMLKAIEKVMYAYTLLTNLTPDESRPSANGWRRIWRIWMLTKRRSR